MPASLPSAPWLNPPDVAGSYLHGAQIGAEQSRIAQEDQKIQIQSQQAQQQMLQEQQRINIEHQYKQQQMALQKQDLEQAKQMNQIKTQEAARQAQARLQFESAVKGGMNPQQAFAQFGPSMMESAAGLGSFYASQAKQQAPAPKWMAGDPATGMPGHFEDYGGSVTIPPGEGKLAPIPESQKLLGGAYEDGLKKANEALAIARQTGKPKLIESAQAQVKEFTDKIESLGKPASAPTPSAAAPTKFKVVSIAPHGSAPSAATAASPSAPATTAQGSPPGADAIVSLASRLGTASVGSTNASPKTDPMANEESALSAWRSGEISKTEAQKVLRRHIMGPEWSTSDIPKKSWHFNMKNGTHVYED